jgi:thiamine transport system substrate-binding protein
MSRVRSIQWAIGIAIAISAFGAAAWLRTDWRGVEVSNSQPQFGTNGGTELRVLAYSSFASSWGPGPALVELFEEQMKLDKTEVTVVLLQAEDAGLLISKMDAFPADIVLGLDQLGLRLAKKQKQWKSHGVSGARYSDEKFLAFDWAPIGFIYRKGEVEPPKDFADLLDARFESSIALQDPRSSSPGFQFLNWLVNEMGEEGAFEYLKKLKPNVHSMSGSWSQAYGLFTRGLAKVAFSYATSILYHRLSEKDDRYAFAKFPVAHPVQIEFAAISEQCRSCSVAQKFMSFLLTPKAQSIIMNRNWMLPINAKAMTGSPFALLLKEIEGQSSTPLIVDPATAMSRANESDPEALLKRWREVEQ